MNSHFTDVNGDVLYYSSSTSLIANLTIENNNLIITPISNGEELITIYSSDLQDMTQGTFSLTVSGFVPELNTTSNSTTNDSIVIISNITINDTTNGANSTIDLNTSSNTNNTNSTINLNNSSNTTDATVNTTLDCSNSDPNSRPIECIQQNNSTYFKVEDIFIENKQGETVGQLTPVGNLLIEGSLIQNSTGSPNMNDYQLGYTNEFADFVPTLWIDTNTGDLHLKGTLVEANGNIPLQDGWSSFINKRGIILALYNPTTGSMIVRGNIIPYRGII